jgi:hypothetical protein
MLSFELGAVVLMSITFFAAFVNGAPAYGFSLPRDHRVVGTMLGSLSRLPGE